MKKVKHNLITIITISSVIISLFIWDCMQEDRYFSENENRILEQKPELTWSDVKNGSFSKSYETYITDQFVLRDDWILMKTYSQKAIGKTEANGVYFAKDGSLIEKHSSEKIDEVKVQKKIERLAAQSEDLLDAISGKVGVMLVPTADQILSDELPEFAESYNQFEFLEQVEEALVEGVYRVPVEEELENRAKEYIYYKTDHHWTTLGAFYGFMSWEKIQGLGDGDSSKIEEYERTTVTSDFLGTLHSKVNMAVEPDAIEVFVPIDNSQNNYQVDYVYSEYQTDTYYDKSYLDGKDKYGMFLDGNHPLIHIQNQVEDMQSKPSILVIKNSYANCFISFLLKYYDNIYVIDPRYNRSDLSNFAIDYEIDDVLYLYDVINFIEQY